jgi:hypothetical protein
MSTLLQCTSRLALGALLAVVALPAAAHAQRMHATPAHAMPPHPMMPMSPAHANTPMGSANMRPMQTSRFMHNLNASLSQTRRTVVRDTLRSATFDRVARLDRRVLSDGLRRQALFAMYAPNPNLYASASGTGTSAGLAGGGTSSGYGGTSSGYGGGYGQASPPADPYGYANATPWSSAPGRQPADPIFDAEGERGADDGLHWPLGLRILPPAPRAQALRRQIEALLQSDAASSADGRISPGAVELATDATEQLRDLLRHRQGSGVMAERTYRDALEYLDRLEVSLLTLER